MNYDTVWGIFETSFCFELPQINKENWQKGAPFRFVSIYLLLFTNYT